MKRLARIAFDLAPQTRDLDVDGAFAAVIAQNADYLSGAIDGSLATHFWSLSIEEQIYLVWPIIVFAIVAICLLIAGAEYFIGLPDWMSVDPKSGRYRP